MKILSTLQNEKIETEERLKAVLELVHNVRKAYGNSEVEITPTKVNSTDGVVPVSLLTPDEKVAVATRAIKNAIAQATAINEAVEGSVFDSEFERIISVDSVLVNLDASSDSKY